MSEEYPGIGKLSELLHRAKSKEQLEQLLELFLTMTEREAIGGRYLIVEGLLKGEKPQRQLAEELGLSISKITAGSNAIKRAPLGLRQFVEVEMKKVKKDG